MIGLSRGRAWRCVLTVTALLSVFFLAPVLAEESLPIVVPVPREVSYGKALFEIKDLDAHIPEGMDPRISAEVESLRGELRFPKEASGGTPLELKLEGKGHPQSYHLRVGKDRVVCTASAPQGLFYGLQSLAQLCVRRGDKVLMRPAEITDSPTYEVRGVICRGGGDEGLAFLKRYKFNLLMTEASRGQEDLKDASRTADLCRHAFIDVLALEGYQDSLLHTDKVEAYYRKRLEAGLTYLSMNFDDLKMAPGQGKDAVRSHLEVVLKVRNALAHVHRNAP